MPKTAPSALIDTTISALFAARRNGASLCPSDIARHIGGDDWRAIMPAVHTHVKAKARRGEVRLTQKGADVQPDSLQGVYRIAMPKYSPAAKA